MASSSRSPKSAAFSVFSRCLIKPVELYARAERVSMRFAGRHVVGRQPAVLPVVDDGFQRARGPALLVDVLGLDHLLDQPQLIVGVENGEVGFQPGQFGVAAQHARADGMERAQPLHALDRAADQRADALLHLARGLVGEGDGQDLRRETRAAWPECARAAW